MAVVVAGVSASAAAAGALSLPPAPPTAPSAVGEVARHRGFLLLRRRESFGCVSSSAVTADVVPQVPTVAKPVPAAPSNEAPSTEAAAREPEENPLQQVTRSIQLFVAGVLEKFKQQEEAAAAPEAVPSAEARALAKATAVVQTV